jgi:hypothetical protein
MTSGSVLLLLDTGRSPPFWQWYFMCNPLKKFRWNFGRISRVKVILGVAEIFLIQKLAPLGTHKDPRRQPCSSERSHRDALTFCFARPEASRWRTTLGAIPETPLQQDSESSTPLDGGHDSIGWVVESEASNVHNTPAWCKGFPRQSEGNCNFIVLPGIAYKYPPGTILEDDKFLDIYF